MTELSTAAQAIVNAAIEDDYGRPTPVLYRRLAATLRAAADQSENLYDPHEGKVSVVRVEHLIAIADELEAQ